MTRRTNPSCRAPRHRARWPFVPLWSAGLLLSVAALAALGYLIGRSHPLHETTAVDSMLVAASSPGAAVALVFGALVLGALCLRQLTLLWLAWRPGSIHVSDFTAGCTLTGATAEQLTMEFRRRLATLQLQSPTPVPGAPPASDFLDVLDDGRAESRNILGTLVSLMRAAKPSYAYAVRGVLLERDDRFSQGVAIEVVRLPSEGVAATTVWDETWERALHRAADEATAAILPQTRACRAPWGCGVVTSCRRSWCTFTRRRFCWSASGVTTRRSSAITTR
ncbi:MAG: hypothetical protein ACXVUE_22125 [Solirubrobacteraceae bacterium]